MGPSGYPFQRWSCTFWVEVGAIHPVERWATSGDEDRGSSGSRLIHRRSGIPLGVKYLCYIECYAVDNRWQLLELAGEFEVVGV